MKLEIFAEDKPAEKVFEYKLKLADNVLLLFHSHALGSDCSSRLIFSFERLTDSLYFPFEMRVFSPFRSDKCFLWHWIVAIFSNKYL